MTKNKDLAYVFCSSMLFGIYIILTLLLMITINDGKTYIVLIKIGLVLLFEIIVDILLMNIIIERGRKLIC